MSPPPARLQAVIFDWAGTTVDHGSNAPASAFVALFERHGVALTQAEARGPMGLSKRDHIAALFALPRVADAWLARHGRPPDESDIDRLYVDFLPIQKAALVRHNEVIAGVPALVAECRRRGLKIGTTTGYTRELMEIVAPAARAGGFAPDVIVCADDVPRGRPAPWMIFRAAEQLDVFPMTSLVTVDDTLVGIEAGRNAGTWTVAVTRTGNSLGLSAAEVEQLDRAELKARLATAASQFQRDGAHYVIETVADLVPVLDEIVKRLESAGK
ncbi:MAG: phosphonoacetaldehyde hydrolase [Isosphaeraceae bacterium]|nr:phosphonoacetaldehyde hydrolase [Isosphaeraceae bacterium]